MTRVRLEQVEAGEVLGEREPRVSWILAGGHGGFVQRSYELELADTTGTESRHVESADSVLVEWPFRPLSSRGSGAVRVRCQGADGRWTEWSDHCELVAGLFEPSDWNARFISPRSLGGLNGGAPNIFTEFHLDMPPVAARLYISAHGIYEPFINGVRVGADIFSPGWTAYEERLRYQSYDVTTVVAQGKNVLGALLGNGWYRGQLVWKDNRSSYGDRLALIAQLEMEFADGSHHVISSDGSWVASATGIEFDDFYDGERRDMRVDNSPNATDSEPVDVLEADGSRLVARRGPAVRVTERVPAVSVHRAESGRILADFGQNLVGWVEITVRGLTSGNEVVIRHAEVLEDNELCLRPLRSAKATCTYIAAGWEQEVFRPTFTFSGFRYIDISGVDESQIVELTAIVLGSHLARIGQFASSHPQLNQLHRNVVWGARGNFLDLPTDCPQRDERLGWTGDIQLFAATANFLFDTSGFLAGWLEDLAVEQFDDGSVPFIIPDVLRYDDAVACGWGDASVIVPMSLHLSFADLGVLKRQYQSMRGWVDKITTLTDSDCVWNAHGQFGDWLDPTAPPDSPAEAKADQAVVATAYYARSTQLLSDAAKYLGDEEAAHSYSNLASRIRDGFERRFVSDDGIVLSDCQTVYALALCGDLISDERIRERAGARLAHLVREADFTVATGLLGTAVILDALVLSDHTDVAYRMLTETRIPSWLYAVNMGATTVWERWDSMLPDGSVNPGEMTSFNHYANGAVADWMHRRIGGLTPTAPGYRKFEIRPLLCAFLDHASISHVSPYGEIAVSWKRIRAQVELTADVPLGTSAAVWVPGASHAEHVGFGRHSWKFIMDELAQPTLSVE